MDFYCLSKNCIAVIQKISLIHEAFLWYNTVTNFNSMVLNICNISYMTKLIISLGFFSMKIAHLPLYFFIDRLTIDQLVHYISRHLGFGEMTLSR